MGIRTVVDECRITVTEQHLRELLAEVVRDEDQAHIDYLVQRIKNAGHVITSYSIINDEPTPSQGPYR